MFGDFEQNPLKWEKVSLGELAEVGSSKRVFKDELIEKGIPFYRGTEIGKLAEGQEIQPELFISKEHYQELCKASGKPDIGDLLLPSICSDGRIWQVDTDNPFYFKDGRVLWIHHISNDYNSTYVLFALKNRVSNDYESIASGTTFSELKIFSLKRCLIFKVPLNLQNQFSDFISEIDKSKYRGEDSRHFLGICYKMVMNMI